MCSNAMQNIIFHRTREYLVFIIDIVIYQMQHDILLRIRKM